MAFDVDCDRRVGSPGGNRSQSNSIFSDRQVKSFKDEALLPVRRIAAGLSPYRRDRVLLGSWLSAYLVAGCRRDDPGQPVGS